MKKILIDIGHPAHVHHFKHFIKELKENDYDVYLTTVDKEITLQLLESFNLEYYLIGKNRNSYQAKALQYLRSVINMVNYVRKVKPILLIGRASPVLALTSFILRIPYIAFADTEDAKLIMKFSFPFAKKVYTPKSYYVDLGDKHVKYLGNHELAYLHPDRFKMDFNILSKYGIEANRKLYFVRFISWNATHDSGHRGLNNQMKIELVNELQKHGKVIVNSETNEIPNELKQYQMNFNPQDVHHILAASNLYVGESTTMASESAVLGVPSIYINSRINGYIEEEKKAGLLFQFKSFIGVLDHIKKILNEYSSYNFKEKHSKFISDKIDVTSYMVNQIKSISS